MSHHQAQDQTSSSKDQHKKEDEDHEHDHEQDNGEDNTQSLESLEHDLANDVEMQQRARVLFENLQTITSRVNAARAGAGIHRRGGDDVTLIAVSKLKPASDILALHKQGQVHFGENYAQELQTKHTLLPSSIAWHFIGSLQTSHCSKLARIPNLHSLHSIDTIKKAHQLSKHRIHLIESFNSSSTDVKNKDADTHTNPNNTTSKEQPQPINVYIQLNTSSESSKSGIDPSSPELLSTAKEIINDCPGLKLVGLMTIGALARSVQSTKENENEDFEILVKEADQLEEQLGWEKGSMKLSMGMSEDFELAVSMGASCVRVGSSIFGQRPKKEDAVI